MGGRKFARKKQKICKRFWENQVGEEKKWYLPRHQIEIGGVECGWRVSCLLTIDVYVSVFRWNVVEISSRSVI